ncbi:MAG: molybdopterin-dependent oxidoreductase [Dehalococcoidales bacterium]|nr:molybdopterin-dependent oxidoreductase [Dehalococcoidales bacterium]
MTEELFTPWKWQPPQDGYIGKRGFISPDAHAKITGKALFTKDVVRPQMLYAKFYLCPFGHSRILSMDTSKAKALEGVVDILRYDDPTINWNPGMLPPGVNNQPVVLPDVAYYYGQPVGAVVVAESEAICDEALRLIEFDWEQLDVIVDWNEAIRSGASLLRPDLNDQNNMREEGVKEHGNLEEGFRQSEKTITFTLNIGEHLAADVEGWSQVVEFDNNDNAKVWFHGQGFNVAEEIVSSFTSQSKIDLFCEYNGGTFGGAIAAGIEGWTLWPALYAAKRTKRPVKMIWHEASYLSADEAVGLLDFKVGFNNDGIINAVQIDTVWSGQLMHGEIENLWGVTKIPNLSLRYKIPYLNRIIPQCFRDGGLSATCQQIVCTRVAAELGMDPIDIALLNDGANGNDINWVIENMREPQGFEPDRDSLRECVEKGKAAFGWDEKFHEPGAKKLANGKYHGVAFTWTKGWLNFPYRRTRAGINIRYDGTADVMYRRADTGVLIHLPYAQVVADEAGLKLEDVVYNSSRHNIGMDTMSEATSSGVATNLMALVMAARKAKQNLLDRSVKPILVAGFGPPMESPPLFPGKTAEELDVKGSFVYEIANPENRKSVKEVVQAWAGWNPIFQHESSQFFTEAFSDVPAYKNTNTGRQCHFIEVEVDVDTGKVDVTKMVMVNDVGKVINPDIVNTQQYGAAAMGMGRSNAQEAIYDSMTGVKLNSDLINFPVIAMNDLGPIDCHIVETAFGYSAYGVSGVGESGSAATMALTQPAIYNAIGKWVDIPTTPDKVLKALGKG